MVALAQAPAVAAPDFARDVMPILETNCLRCHNTAEQKGGLLLEAYEDLMRGGDDGSPIVAGQADDSPLIRQVEGRAKPKMPPKADLRPEDIAILRAWIAAGAKYSPSKHVSLDEKVPALAQTASLLPEVPSMAFSPDGKELAVAGYREVRRFTMPPGQEPAAVKGMADQVRALAWSPDGRMIAAGGGTPGAFGELVLIDAASGSVVRTLEGHRDYVYHVAFSPDGKRLASCGYDKLIRIWDTATGKPTGVLKEHTEAVYAVAFNASGTLLASASADRSIKIWDVAKGVRLYTINDPTDADAHAGVPPRHGRSVCRRRRQAAAGLDDQRHVSDLDWKYARAHRRDHSIGVLARWRPPGHVVYGSPGEAVVGRGPAGAETVRRAE